MCPSPARRPGLALLVVFCAWGIVACEESVLGPNPPSAGPDAVIVAVTSTQLAAQFGVQLDTPIRVRVLDAQGRPIRSAVVKYSVLAGTGVFSADSTLTDDQGFTEVLFRPMSTGTVIVEARVQRPGGADRVQFTIRVLADPDVATEFFRVSGGGQTAPIGAVLPKPLVVEVRNANGGPVDSFPVSFTLEEARGDRGVAGVASSPSGSFTAQVTVLTDASGRARAFVRLGTEPGPHVVTASGVIVVDGAGTTESVTFRAEAVPIDEVDILLPIAGQDQTVTIDTLHAEESPDFQGEDPNPLVVQALDEFGNPIEDATISWFLSDGSGTLESLQTLTDEDGLTVNTIRDVSEGRNVVVAFAPGADPVEFTITGEMLEPAEEEGGGGG
ncbi:MAG: Ig-like domain-containing protein [Gemmatimonadota bacterium]|nr:Ig-like domain-containing protein [Gemmatimonadota bacterium]